MVLLFSFLPAEGSNQTYWCLLGALQGEKFGSVGHLGNSPPKAFTIDSAQPIVTAL
ncbi:MAG: hypothetical protein P4L91_06045 [Burkholderiaceae bacterium]|jgi:hypothetical protein|nr:hypothetical protein [Burkholderiaceae bacterium]